MKFYISKNWIMSNIPKEDGVSIEAGAPPTLKPMRSGWSLGVAKPHHATRIYHYFAGAINLSLCKRVTRSSAHEVLDSPDSGLRCAKCDKRHNEPPKKHP